MLELVDQSGARYGILHTLNLSPPIAKISNFAGRHQQSCYVESWWEKGDQLEGYNWEGGGLEERHCGGVKRKSQDLALWEAGLPVRRCIEKWGKERGLRIVCCALPWTSGQMLGPGTEVGKSETSKVGAKDWKFRVLFDHVKFKIQRWCDLTKAV